MNLKAKQDIQRKLHVLRYAEEIKNISKACRHFGISRDTFYQWKRAYKEKGEVGLINRYALSSKSKAPLSKRH